MGGIGTNIHQRGDVSAAFAHGIALKQLAGLEKHHDGYGLLIFAQQNRTNGGHCHQKVFVKGVTAADTVEGTQQNVVTCKKIRRKPQKLPQAHRLQHRQQHCQCS